MKNHLPKLIIFLLLASFLLPLVASAVVEIPNPLKANSFAELITALVNFIFYLAIAIAPIIIIIAAFYLLTSAGDPAKVQTAKDIILYTVIGLIIIFLSLAIVSLLQKMLGVKP